MQIIEQYTQGKSTTTPSEDSVVVNAYYAAVIDGATPKTRFRYPGNETPGHLAARTITEAISALEPGITAQEAIRRISEAIRKGTEQASAQISTPGQITFETLEACNRPIASVVIYSATKREIWMVGDCQYLLPELNEHQQGSKRIDILLAQWRSDIDTSLLRRGIMTKEEIAANDPGRAIIQPHITHQVRYQNRTDNHPLAYAMLDGSEIPSQFIRVCSIPAGITKLVLATDGYPTLFPTLRQTEQHLAQLIKDDPLCIGPLMGTKGIRPGNNSYDDRTYLSVEL